MSICAWLAIPAILIALVSMLVRKGLKAHQALKPQKPEAEEVLSRLKDECQEELRVIAAHIANRLTLETALKPWPNEFWPSTYELTLKPRLKRPADKATVNDMLVDCAERFIKRPDIPKYRVRINFPPSRNKERTS